MADARPLEDTSRILEFRDRRRMKEAPVITLASGERGGTMDGRVGLDLGGWLSGSCLSDDEILADLAKTFPSYFIGREFARGRRRYFAVLRKDGEGPFHTLLTADLEELALELLGWP